jgi:thiamine-phosphate pyrophosphorylase
VDVDERRQRLAAARLYLVCDAEPDERLEAALRGGVDIVQLRMKNAEDERVLSAAARRRARCHDRGALFLLNDRPDLAARIDADGVHVGQEDVPVAQARAAVGPARLVGLSTHTPAQVDAAAGVDYIGVGPVHATPTKPGRPAVGLELVRYAAARARVPFFAIGGIGPENVDAVRAAGARRVAVVRAITQAADPQSAAISLRRALAGEVRVGAA